MDITISSPTPSKARKRERDPEKWQRNKAKKLRYSSQRSPTVPNCNHKKKIFKCFHLKMKDLLYFHALFFKITDKIVQDNFILKYCTPKQIRRMRTVNGNHKNQSFHTNFRVKRSDKSVVSVCQKTFLGILGITKHRVQTVMKHFITYGTNFVEKRGGDRRSKKYAPKLDNVKQFICSLKCSEPHYCRGSVSGRKYLTSDLSINKLVKMYNIQAAAEFQVKASYFRKVFNKCFNLGFGSPRTDVCSKCMEFSEKIKIEKDVEKKNDLMIQKRVHSLKAKAFFDKLKERTDGLKILSFDCQKNLVLPKVPDQSAYYSRQLYLYNFCVVEGDSGQKLNPQNVTCYCWTENEHAKGSNEISSAVFDRLSKMSLEGINTIRLVADGCGGQNKNSTLLGMCCSWLISKAPESVKDIELVFPVTGHSYIPPDRVFGNIEKIIKTKETIINPREYLDIISEHSSIIRLGKDCDVFNWKKSIQWVFKIPASWHFKFSVCKRFLLRKSSTRNNILIKGEPHYKTEIGEYKSVCKKGVNVTMIDPDIIQCGNNKVKSEKLKDVDNLLNKHFGDWKKLENLSFYNEVLREKDGEQPFNEDDEINNEYNTCEASEEVDDLII